MTYCIDRNEPLFDMIGINDTSKMCQSFIPITLLYISLIINSETLIKEHINFTARSIKTNERYCYEFIGCLGNSKNWYHKKYRPVNLEPLERHTIKTTFVLYSLNTSDKVLDYETVPSHKNGINNLYLREGNGTSTIFILIHDFTSNGYTGWIKNFAKVLLKIDHDGYVFSIDWESGAEPPFDQAIANARVVALEVVAFLKIILDVYTINASKIHIFGHGVGAHIAGYVGKTVQGIGKITALDPTGPRFEFMPTEVRLDRSDAQYVEVLHTDSYGGAALSFITILDKHQGSTEKMGHVDFYVNGGGPQPHCPKSNYTSIINLKRSDLKQGIILPDCSHKAALSYYCEALKESNHCEFIGFSGNFCSNFAKAGATGDCRKEGNCAKFGDVHGVKVNKLENEWYFIRTNDVEPYCLQPYKIVINLEYNPKARLRINGYFDLKFVSTSGNTSNGTSKKHKRNRVFERGQSYSILYYTAPLKITDIKKALVKWTHVRKCIGKWICRILPFTFCKRANYVKDIEIHEINLNDDKSRSTAEMIRMCPINGTKLPNKVYVQFEPCKDNSNGPESIIFANETMKCVRIAAKTSKKPSL